MLITKRLAAEQSGAEVAGLEDRDLRCRIGAGAPSGDKACFLNRPRSLFWLGLTHGGARRAAAVRRQCGGGCAAACSWAQIGLHCDCAAESGTMG